MKVVAKKGMGEQTRNVSVPVIRKKSNGKKIEKMVLAFVSVLFSALVLSWPVLSKVRAPAALFALVLPFAAKHVYSRLAKSKRIRRLEEGLSTALLMASAYDSASLELVPESISRADMGEPSTVFGKASQLISAGYSYE